MPEVRPAFGKKGVRPIQHELITSNPTRYGLIAGAAVIVLAVALSIFFLMKNFEAPTDRVSLAAVSVTTINGVWAANGQDCGTAKMRIELDGDTLTSISALGRVPIGRYTLSGSNPITLSFPNGDHIVWDATFENKLIPISISPNNGTGRFQMMHLTRC